jgi:hypothetical protein
VHEPALLTILGAVSTIVNGLRVRPRETGP